jgi:anaerobic ribonucleoside-triphosphate reductase
MNSNGAVKKVTHHMNGAQSSTSGSSSEDHILSLKSEFAEKESQYQAKIA